MEKSKPKCPCCQHGKPKVMDGWKEDDVYVRRYRCPLCNAKWRTAEVTLDDTVVRGDLLLQAAA